MDRNDTFYHAVVRPTRIAVVTYAVIKQIFYSILVPDGPGWKIRLIINAVWVGGIFAFTATKKLTRRQITFLVLFISMMAEISFYVMVDGDRLIFPFIIGCSLLSIMYSDLKAALAALGLPLVIFAAILFAFDISVVGMRYEHIDSILDFGSAVAIGIMAVLIGRYTIGVLDKARLEAEAATRAKGDLLAQVENDAKMFHTLYEVSHKLSAALSEGRIYKTVADIVPQVIPSCGRILFMLYDPAINRLVIRHIAGNKGELEEGMAFAPDSRGVYAFAFNSGNVVNIPDLQSVDNYRFEPEEAPNLTTRSLIVIPLLSGEQRLGLFSAESGEFRLFGLDIERVLKTLIDNASVAIARAQLYAGMETLATTDALTGLSNRRQFNTVMASEFQRARRYDRPLSLLMADIDNFKAFNDTYGHQVGDLVLREISATMRGALRTSDFPARYGGEEFAVILPETGEEEALLMAERMRRAVEANVIKCGGDDRRVTISVGGVTYPVYGTSDEEIVNRADMALYASKRNGRNRVSMYNRDIALWEAFEAR